jgi:heterodisulfide reductase subunit C
MGGKMSSAVIKFEENGLNFNETVRSVHGAENLMVCYHCGTCTAGCPVARVSDKFRPQLVLRIAQLGLEELALDKKSPVWLCTGCYNCTEWCPQNVHPTEIFMAMKGLAARRGIIPMGRKMSFSLLVKKGRMFDVKEKQQEERAELGLAPCPEPDTEQTLALLERGGILPILTGRK